MEEYPSEEQGIVEKKEEDEDLEIEIGEKEEDIYSEKGREHLIENDEINTKEEGIMQGVEEASTYKKNIDLDEEDTEFKEKEQEETSFTQQAKLEEE